MRIITSLAFLVLFSTLTFAGNAFTKNNTELSSLEKNTLLQQYFLVFPPFWQKADNNTFTGLHYRLAEKLYQHANLNVKFINVPYQRMQFQVSQGKTAFINYGKVADDKIDHAFHVCIPPSTITLKVYYIKSDLPKITTMEGFANKNIIIMHGLPLGSYEGIKSDKSINFMKPRTIEAAIQGLKGNRGDYFIGFDNIMIGAQQRFFSDAQQLKSYPLVTMLGYPIVTPKTFPGGKQVCAKVSASYKELVKKGVIHEKYKVLNSDLHEYPYKDL